eukprot:2909297-Rhodomonas_salina.4
MRRQMRSAGNPMQNAGNRMQNASNQMQDAGNQTQNASKQLAKTWASRCKNASQSDANRNNAKHERTWMTESPTAPQPKTATEAPFSTLQGFHTAPHPVETPHPSRHIFSSGAAWSTCRPPNAAARVQCSRCSRNVVEVGRDGMLTLAQEIAARTVYSEKVEQPI